MNQALPLSEESGDLGTAVAAATNLGLLYLYKSRNEAVADPASELLVQAVEILLKGEAQARKLAADQARTPEFAEAEIDLGDVFLELNTRFRGWQSGGPGLSGRHGHGLSGLRAAVL